MKHNIISQENSTTYLAEKLADYWKIRLSDECPEQSVANRESIVKWLLGEDLNRYEQLNAKDLDIAKQAMEYRWRILCQRYLGKGRDVAYRNLITRLSSLTTLRNKIQTWVFLSRDRQRTILDVLQEVIQELLQSDNYMLFQMSYIAKCTNEPRLKNALLFASVEEYCLRPIRNQPLLVYRFVNYLRRTSHGGLTRVSTSDLIKLVSEEVLTDDNDNRENLVDTQAIAEYQEAQDLEEQQTLRSDVKQEFENYLKENLGEEAVQWLRMYLRGESQDAIAKKLNKPIKEIYRLREKISYHAVRVFALKNNPELVDTWLGTSLIEHNFGLTPAQWKELCEKLTPTQREILELRKAGESIEALAPKLKLKAHQAMGEWTKVYLAAQALRDSDNVSVQEESTFDKAFLSYQILLTVPSEPISVGEEVEFQVELNASSHNIDSVYFLQIPQNTATGSELNVIINAPGFLFNGDNTASIPLDPDINQLAQTARFRLTALRPGTNTITAELYHGDIFETKLENSIQVTNFDEASLTAITTQPRPIPQPDFILQVKTICNLTSYTCSFQYLLRSFRFPSMFTASNIYNSESLSSSWLQQVRELLASTLSNISDSLPCEGKSCLTSLGQYLFRRLFPTDLQSDFRTLIPRNSTFTLLILADEGASIPWELLHDGQSFLGERFIIGRWLWELNDTRPYEFPVGAVNVAHYANVEQPQLWINLLEVRGAPLPKPLLEGVLNNLDSTEAMRGLHLIRYAQADRISNAPVRVDSTDNTEDIELQVRPVKLNLRRNRPLVSLSYVKTDITEITNLEETWAATFIRAGCSAFIGALWSVSPNVEAAFIGCFYNRLWAGDSIGKAFDSSRKLACAVAPDSLDWLAYVLFADPMARPYCPVEGKGYAVVEPIGREVNDAVIPGVPIRFRLSLRRTPPVWHEERVIEVAENLSFENLQVHVKTFGFQVNPDSVITMNLAPAGNYIGWFTLVAPVEMANSSAVVQVYFMDGIMPIHSIMFSLNIASDGGDAV